MQACLRALELSRSRVDEIVVSDDGSSREAVNRMKAFFRDVSIPLRYTWQEDGGFRPAAARNNAIRISSGDYLINLDCDILLLPDAVDVHLHNAKPGRFLAGNRAILNERLSRNVLAGALSVELMEELWGQADRRHLPRISRQFERNRLLRKLKLARRHKPKIIGCHFSLFREDAYRVNGFDENYVGWGLEDDDFAMRLHGAGITGRSIIRQARALHLFHEDADSRPRNLSESLNMDYFNRPEVPAYCSRGLVTASERGTAAT